LVQCPGRLNLNLLQRRRPLVKSLPVWVLLLVVPHLLQQILMKGYFYPFPSLQTLGNFLRLLYSIIVTIFILFYFIFLSIWIKYSYDVTLTSLQNLWSLLRRRQNMQLMLLNTFLIAMSCFNTTAQTRYQNNYWKM